MMQFDKPANNIGEITLIGTGGGYGESCLVHLGNGKWYVIDSCIDPDSKKSLPLEYLQKIGVDVATQVKGVICTHWHNDHILGISELFAACTNAKFYCTRSNDVKKFLALLSLDYQKAQINVSNASMVEFLACFEILKKREGSKMNRVFANVIIDRHIVDEHECGMTALSPSDYTLDKFDDEIGTLITEYGDLNRKIVYTSPNMKSIALYIKFGSHRAILGADLEFRDTEHEGWNHVLQNKVVIDKKASLFKLAHHGSSTGYSDRLFIELLEEKPVSKLTPWNRNGKLPEPEMLKQFCSYSDKVYITSPHISDKPKKRDKQTEKLIKKWNDTLTEVKFNLGIVRSRIPIDDDNSAWTVETSGAAFHVNQTL